MNTRTEVQRDDNRINVGDYVMGGPLAKTDGRATPNNIVRIPVEKIKIPMRERKIDPKVVDRLYHDITMSGLLQPVGLRQTTEGTWDVIYGAHRVLAYKRGWEEAQKALAADPKGLEAVKIAAMWQSIPAIIHDHDIPKDYAVMKEIAENLIRGELTSAERAIAETKYTHLQKKWKLVIPADEKRATNAKNQYSEKKEGPSQVENHPQLVAPIPQLPTATEKVTKDLGISTASLHRSHDKVNDLAASVARDKGLLPPTRVTPESAATPEAEHTIRLAELGAKEKAKAKAEGKDERKVHPTQPTPENIVTVRIDLSDPKKVADWFKARINIAEKPLTTKFLRELAVELMKAVEEIDGVEVPAFLKR